MVIDISRKKWTRHIAYAKAMRNMLKMMTEKPSQKRPLGKCRFIWIDNVNINLGATGKGRLHQSGE